MKEKIKIIIFSIQIQQRVSFATPQPSPNRIFFRYGNKDRIDLYLNIELS